MGDEELTKGKYEKVGEYIDTVLTRLLPPSFTLPDIASQCAVCRSWPARPVCQPCVARFVSVAPRCRRCALTLPADLSLGLRSHPGLCLSCITHAPPLDAALAAVAYAFPWSDLIAHYKFGGKSGWSSFFAGLLLQTPGVPAALAAMGADDWILPMPLSAQRLQSRGFNQAWALAQALARQAGCRARPDARLLLRVKDTRPQSQLKREARLANVKGAFMVEPLRAAALAGRRVVLVDDVMTSGASLSTAAQALRDAGAAHITAVVLARTE